MKKSNSFLLSRKFQTSNRPPEHRKANDFSLLPLIPSLMNRHRDEKSFFWEEKEKLRDTCARKANNSVAFVYSRERKKGERKKSNILTLILLAFYGNYFPQRPLRRTFVARCTRIPRYPHSGPGTITLFALLFLPRF